MAIVDIITANCENGKLSQGVIARRWDDNGTLIQFAGYPEPDDEEQLIYRLIVWMKASEDADPSELPPIELEADQWLISNVYTQLAQTIRFQLCITNESGTYEKHSPIFAGNIGKSLSHNGEEADIDVSELFDPYKKYVDELVVAAGAVVIDTDLDTAGAAADAKATGDALAGLNGRLEELEDGGTGGLTADVKAALLACFNHVAWDSDDPTGQSYISALQTALYPPANLSSISAVFTQSGTVYDSDALDSLKSSLVVTAHYSDSTTETISNYTLSGTLTEGTSTITVTYGGKSTTFTVTVTSSHVSNPYLADNMILWLDGIYNKSTGHDEYSTVWEDLISGETFTNTGITVATDGMVFDGTTGHGFLGDAPSNIGTIEILLDVTNPSTTQAVIGGFGNSDPGNVSVKSGNLLQRKGSTNGGGHAIPTGLHTHTFVIGGSQYVDGESVSNVATTISFTSTGKMSIGNALNANQGLDTGSGAYPLTGTIKCIRLYSDSLTAEEVASNYAVDVTRFNLS